MPHFARWCNRKLGPSAFYYTISRTGILKTLQFIKHSIFILVPTYKYSVLKVSFDSYVGLSGIEALVHLAYTLHSTSIYFGQMAGTGM